MNRYEGIILLSVPRHSVGDDGLMSQSNDNDKQIELVQSSTHNLMTSFRDKTESLTKCSDDIKLLLREGYDIKLAKETAERFFGKKKFHLSL
jgi:hypothetical protein